jgi:hypothetical protein
MCPFAMKRHAPGKSTNMNANLKFRMRSFESNIRIASRSLACLAAQVLGVTLHATSAIYQVQESSEKV